MQNRFDIQSTPPLRADPRATRSHVQGVDATPGGLIRATLGAGFAGALILGLFYLPAEYGVDPTGIGGLLGLTEMGEIKQDLYAEAAAEDAVLAAQVQELQPIPYGDILGRLDRIDAQLAAVAAVIGADGLILAPAPAAVEPEEPAPEPEVVSEPVAQAAAEEVAASEAPAVETPAIDAAVAEAVAEPVADGTWRDEASYTLAPGEGIEVKLVMEEGQTARFEWTANGAVVNYDTHAEGSGQKISYEQGRGVGEQTGELTAAFTGNHGWFWRNRSDAPLTITLRTAGEYSEMKAP
jgi:hypothetical protein